MKRSGLPDGFCDFGDYVTIASDPDGTFRLDTMRGEPGQLEYKTWESGFLTKQLARQRATSLVLSPPSRRSRFAFVRGGLLLLALALSSCGGIDRLPQDMDDRAHNILVQQCLHAWNLCLKTSVPATTCEAQWTAAGCP